MVANSTFLWPYNWPLDWPIWCNLSTEGVVSYEELGNAKKALSKKCASSVHPKNATVEALFTLAEILTPLGLPRQSTASPAMVQNFCQCKQGLKDLAKKIGQDSEIFFDDEKA